MCVYTHLFFHSFFKICHIKLQTWALTYKLFFQIYHHYYRQRVLETSEVSAVLMYTWTFFVVLTLESKSSCWVVWTEEGTCCFEEKSLEITCFLIHSYSISQRKEWWLHCVSWDPMSQRLLTVPWLLPNIAKLERKKKLLSGVPIKCYKYVGKLD